MLLTFDTFQSEKIIALRMLLYLDLKTQTENFN